MCVCVYCEKEKERGNLSSKLMGLSIIPSLTSSSHKEKGLVTLEHSLGCVVSAVLLLCNPDFSSLFTVVVS